MGKKLYVGNLNYATTVPDLEELFGTVGTVDTVNLITDRMTGRSKGFAFVEMESEDDAAAAISQLNGRDVDGRTIKVAEARPRQDNRGGGGGRRDRW